MLKRLAGAMLSAASIAAIAAAAPTDAHAQTASYNIRAGSLRAALDAWARQSGRQVIYRSDEIRSARSRGAQGALSADAALDALLAGSGFAAMADASGAVAIVRADPASGEAGAAGAAADNESAVEQRIIVTGTNIANSRPTGSQLLTVRRDDIDRAGHTTMEQVFQALPQNFGGGASQTLNSNIRGFSGLNTAVGSGVNLRGLGNGATLTLLNGQRVAPAGQGTFVDISLIPTSVVERVEILTDGASAIYGSDAIGGVVNIITRSNFDGAQTRLQYGTVTDGGRDEYSFGQLFGHSWADGNITVDFNYQHQDALPASDRDFAAGLLHPTDLLVEQTAQTGLVTLDQQLGVGTRARATLFYGRREFDQSFTPTPGVTRLSEGTAEGGLANLELEQDLGDRWEARLIGSYSFNELDRVDEIGGVRTPVANPYSTWVVEGRLTGDLIRLPAGFVRLAAGASYREEAARSTAYDRSRHLMSIYGEMLVPVFADVPGLQRLDLSVAGRYDDYSDFGGTFNPKFGVDWEIVDGVLFRSSYSTSFRAPLFFEQAFPLSGLIFDLPDPRSTRPDGLSTVILLAGGNPDLTAEEARSWTVGFEVAPPSINLRASINYFDIEYEGQIQELFNNFAVTFFQNEEALADFIVRDPPDQLVGELIGRMPGGIFDFNTFQFFTDPADVLAAYTIGAVFEGQFQNAGTTRVRGFDFDLRYARGLFAGTLNLGLSATWLLEYSLSATQGSPAIELLDTVFNPIDFRARAEASWVGEHWSFSAFVNHADDYDDPGSTFTGGGAVPSWTTVDAQVRYEFGENANTFGGLEIAFTIFNLFDEEPPLIAALPFQLPYDAENANPLGRLISVSIVKNW